MRRKALGLVVFMALAALGVGAYLGLAALTDGTAQAQGVVIRVKFSYAVKFLCGIEIPGAVDEDTVYATKINIHNPQSKEVIFAKKAVHLLPGQRATQPGQRFAEILEPDWSLEMDCQDILGLLPVSETGHEGFVVFESPTELDVVAVYTARSEVDLTTDEETTRVECADVSGNRDTVSFSTITDDCNVSSDVGGHGVGIGRGIGRGIGVGLTMDVEYILGKKVELRVIAEPRAE